MFLIGQNMQIFEEVLFFQAMYNVKTENEQSVHLAYVFWQRPNIKLT